MPKDDKLQASRFEQKYIIRELLALENFYQLMHEHQAKPKVHIAYLREAYVPHDDNSARLTMDRMVSAEAETVARLSTQMRDPVVVWGKEVVLELKFTDRFPQWFGDLVRVFGLRQCGAAKYVDGAALLGENGIMRRRRAMDWAAAGRFD